MSNLTTNEPNHVERSWRLQLHVLCNLRQDVFSKPKRDLTRLAYNGRVLQILSGHLLHVSAGNPYE